MDDVTLKLPKNLECIIMCNAGLKDLLGDVIYKLFKDVNENTQPILSRNNTRETLYEGITLKRKYINESTETEHVLKVPKIDEEESEYMSEKGKEPDLNEP